jgi:predicted dehydrogenase
MHRTSVGIVGLGYWGPNWLRNFAALDECDLAMACDQRKERIDKFARMYPATTFTASYEDLLKNPSLDAIVIATPTSSHFPLAKQALESGKHVLLEKPMAGTVAEAKELVALAKRRKKLLLVDHTFMYTQAVTTIRSAVLEKKLGDLLYFDSIRINLGIIQKDTNVLWDLAVHDLTILAAIKDLGDITEVLATGSAHFTKNVEDAHLHLAFNDGFAAHIHASWLSPVKIRQTLIAGRKRMIVYNDMEPSEKIRFYDKGVERDDTKPDPFFPKYRSGDVLIPALPLTEALLVEARHFIRCIRGEEQPLVSGEDGLRMIQILTAADESLKKKRPVTLGA